MVERYETWVILGHAYGLFAIFHAIDSVLDDTYEQVLYYHQILSCIWNKTVLPGNFVISVFE